MSTFIMSVDIVDGNNSRLYWPLQELLDAATDPWGVDVERVEMYVYEGCSESFETGPIFSVGEDKIKQKFIMFYFNTSSIMV